MQESYIFHQKINIEINIFTIILFLKRFECYFKSYVKLCIPLRPKMGKRQFPATSKTHHPVQRCDRISATAHP